MMNTRWMALPLSFALLLVINALQAWQRRRQGGVK